MKMIIQICQTDHQGFRRWRKGGKWAKAYHMPSWGLGSWDPAVKEQHMMTYDKQLKDFTTMYHEEDILEGDEEMGSSCKFL